MEISKESGTELVISTIDIGEILRYVHEGRIKSSSKEKKKMQEPSRRGLL